MCLLVGVYFYLFCRRMNKQQMIIIASFQMIRNAHMDLFRHRFGMNGKRAGLICHVGWNWTENKLLAFLISAENGGIFNQTELELGGILGKAFWTLNYLAQRKFVSTLAEFHFANENCTFEIEEPCLWNWNKQKTPRCAIKLVDILVEKCMPLNAKIKPVVSQSK